eukprot:XP_003973745.2 PREDICTED: lumican-like [Takifugu rubripes]
MVSLDPQVLCGLVAFRQKTLSLSLSHTHTHRVPRGFAGNVNRTSLFCEAGASLCFVRAGFSVSMALSCRILTVLLLACGAISGAEADMDYGGVPLWINHLAGEPSVMSLHGRLGPAWIRANNLHGCPRRCVCPVHWPTAVYCDHGNLTDAPNDLPDRTQYLFLQRNNISSLSSSLTNTTDLRWLILDHNQLRSDKLDQAALQSQTQMCYLFANHNNLESVPNTLPAGLQELRLAHNRVSSISPGAFRNMSKLRLLLLQGNRLQTITGGDLKGLLSLTLLELSGNLLSSVPTHLPPSIQQLYLSDNSLSQLSDDSFSGLSGLKYLRLSRCGLQSSGLHPQVFNLSSLVELDLSYNKLAAIPTVPTSLQYLYLEANEIKGFNTTSFCREVGPLSYSRMKVLRLDGNNMSYQQIPPDWMLCLRVLQSIYL